MSRNKQLAMNMVFGLFAYVSGYCINFFLSPYIVKNIGVDAYGFIGLSNNFISYAGLVAIALNSMAGRFITIKIQEKNSEEINKYFSSVFYANLILTIIMATIAFFVVTFLEYLIVIPKALFMDVKFLFMLLFFNCLVGTLGSVYGVATFATNKLYLDSFRQTEAKILNFFLTILLFVCFEPRVSFLGLAALFSGLYSFIFNIYYTKKLLPNVSIKRKYFDINIILELLSSGVWNLITRVGQLLLEGLDLLITNLLISPTAMGILSLSKTLPNMVIGVVGTLNVAFSPDFTILYAQQKKEELLNSLKRAMKIMGIICNIPVIILLICGDLFFSLWQPTQNAMQLQILSILACGTVIFSGSINSVYNIFTVVNKIKVNSIVVIFSGIINAIVVYVLLKTTDLGIYAVAGVSTVMSIARNLIFTVPYGAWCLGEKWHSLYPSIFKSVLFVFISFSICYFIKNNFVFEGWLGLLLLGGISFVIALCVAFFIMLDADERIYLFNKLRKDKK